MTFVDHRCIIHASLDFCGVIVHSCCGVIVNSNVHSCCTVDRDMGDPLLTEWTRYFGDIIEFLRGADRQYGVANELFSDYVVERLDLCISTCTSVIDHLVPSGTIDSDEAAIVAEYKSEACHLLDCLKDIQLQWREYREVIDARVLDFSFRAGIVRSGTRGRPRFNISKDQLEYLSSLAFSWTEVASLLGVSRMSIYRYNNYRYTIHG